MNPEELKKIISKAVQDGVQEVEKSIIDKVGTTVDEKLEKVNERMEKIEKLPARTAPGSEAPAVHGDRKYCGYDLREQGEALRSKIHTLTAKHGKDYMPAMKSDEGFEKWQKWCIDYKLAVINRDPDAMKRLHVQKATDLAEGTDNVGGYLVPPDYQPEIIKLVREDSFAMQECTVVPMSVDVREYPAEASLVTVSWTAEAGAITASNPTWAQVLLTAKKLAGLTSGISNELVNDSAFDLVSILSEQFGYAIGQELDNQVLNGTGDPTSGILTAIAGYSVIMGTGSTNFSSVGANDFRSMIRKVSKKDAVNGKFIYSKDLQFYIDTLKDTQGRYIYREPGDPAQPGALWGRPVIESVNAPAESDSGTSTACATFGDYKKVYIGRRKGIMTLDADPYTNFNKDQVRFRMTTRWAIKVARASAIVRLLTAGA